jgi:hypothetical protein
MELEKLTLDELVALNTKIEIEIDNREDGFFYILHIRSFGSVSEQKCKNEVSAQINCYYYNGDNGIIDLYTNNKECKIKNYGGSKYFIDSEENYHSWKSWAKDKSTVERYEEMGTLPDLLIKAKEEFEKLYSNKIITEPEEILLDI